MADGHLTVTKLKDFLQQDMMMIPTKQMSSDCPHFNLLSLSTAQYSLLELSAQLSAGS
jgi:hypothetical protein